MRQDRYEEANGSFSLSFRTCLEMSSFGLNLETRAENPAPKHLRYFKAIFVRNSVFNP